MPNTRKSDPPALVNDDLPRGVVQEFSSPFPSVFVKSNPLVLVNKKVSLLTKPAPKPKLSAFQKFEKVNFRLAKGLHDAAFIYAIYGALDGLSLSYSTLKYAFDIATTNHALSASDEMHEWMTTPGGLLTAACESVGIIALSLIANTVKDDCRDAFKRFIAFIWPYFRDTMKGLKNAYKGIRSSFQALGALASQDLHHMIVPVGVVMGVLSVANRIWYRQMKDKRKEQQKANSEASFAIQDLENMNEHVREVFRKGYEVCLLTNPNVILKDKLYFSLNKEMLQYTVITPTGETITDDIELISDAKKAKTGDPLETQFKSPMTLDQIIPWMPQIIQITSKRGHTYRAQGIQKQSRDLRVKGMLSAAYGGVVDGLYLYMGVMGVMVLAPQIFVAMLVSSVIFAAMCIATRMYEEYDYQRRLVATEAGIELACCVKEIEFLFYELQDLVKLELSGAEGANSTERSEKKKSLMLRVDVLLLELERRRNDVRAQVTLSYTAAALAGLKNGMAAYMSISSMLFAAIAINMLFFGTFPPAFLVGCVVAGLVSLVGFLTLSLIRNYNHLQRIQLKEGEPKTEFAKLLILINSKEHQIDYLDDEVVKKSAAQDLEVETSPPSFIEEWCEIARSFFSGFNKGQKSVDFALAPVQNPDEHDSPLSLWITGLSGWIYALGLALRAYARGLGENAYHKLGPDKPTPSEEANVSAPSPKSPVPASAQAVVPKVPAIEAKTIKPSVLSTPLYVLPAVATPKPPAAVLVKPPVVLPIEKPAPLVKHQKFAKEAPPLVPVPKKKREKKPKKVAQRVVALEVVAFKGVLQAEVSPTKEVAPERAKPEPLPRPKSRPELAVGKVLLETVPEEEKSLTTKPEDSPRAFVVRKKSDGNVVPLSESGGGAAVSQPLSEPLSLLSPKVTSTKRAIIGFLPGLLRRAEPSRGSLDEMITPVVARPTPASTVEKPGGAALLEVSGEPSVVILERRTLFDKVNAGGDSPHHLRCGEVMAFPRFGSVVNFFKPAELAKMKATPLPLSPVDHVDASVGLTQDHCTFYIDNAS